MKKSLRRFNTLSRISSSGYFRSDQSRNSRSSISCGNVDIVEEGREDCFEINGRRNIFTQEFFSQKLEEEYQSSNLKGLILRSSTVVYGMTLIAIVAIFSLLFQKNLKYSDSAHTWGVLLILTNLTFFPTPCCLFFCLNRCCCSKNGPLFICRKRGESWIWGYGALVFELSTLVPFFLNSLYTVFFRSDDVRVLGQYPITISLVFLILAPRIKVAPLYLIFSYFPTFFHSCYDIWKMKDRYVPIYHTFFPLNTLSVLIIILVFLSVNERHKRNLFHKNFLAEIRGRELARRIFQSEELLRNILPSFLIDQIELSKKDGLKYMKSFSDLVYLQSDFVGFTKFCSENDPEFVIKFLNDIFLKFDIKQEEFLYFEKNRTIGDAYVVLADPFREKLRNVSIRDVCLGLSLFGLEMQRDLLQYNMKNKSNIEMRVGICCDKGSIIVFGSSRISFDVIGRVSRNCELLESSCFPGRIQVNDIIRREICKNKQELSFQFENSPCGFHIIELGDQESWKKRSVLLRKYSSYKNFDFDNYFESCEDPFVSTEGEDNMFCKTTNSEEDDDEDDNNIIEGEEYYDDRVEEYCKKLRKRNHKKERIKWYEIVLQTFWKRSTKAEWRVHSNSSFSTRFIMVVLSFYIIYFSSLTLLITNFFLDFSLRQRLISIIVAFSTISFQIGFSCFYLMINQRKYPTIITILYILHILVVVAYYFALIIQDFEVYLSSRTCINSLLGLWLFAVPIAIPYFKVPVAIFAVYTPHFFFAKFYYYDHLKNYHENNSLSQASIEYDLQFVWAMSSIFLFYSVVQRTSRMKSFCKIRTLRRIVDQNEEKVEMNNLLLRSVLPSDVIRRINSKIIEGGGGKLSCSFVDSYYSCIGFLKIDHFYEHLERNPKRTVHFMNDFFNLADSLLDTINHERESRCFPSVKKIKSVCENYLFYSTDPDRCCLDCLLFSCYLLNHDYLNKNRLTEEDELEQQQQPQIGIKIGLNCGDRTYFGIVGVSKFLYDCFGDVVNLASRLMTTGKVGKIQVSEKLLKEVTDKIPQISEAVEERGFVNLKGKGDVKTYWVVPGNVDSDLFSDCL